MDSTNVTWDIAVLRGSQNKHKVYVGIDGAQTCRIQNVPITILRFTVPTRPDGFRNLFGMDGHGVVG